MFFSKKKIVKLKLNGCRNNINRSQFNLLLHRKLYNGLFSSVSPINSGFSSKLNIGKHNYYLFIPVIKFLVSNNVIFTISNYQ